MWSQGQIEWMNTLFQPEPQPKCYKWTDSPIYQSNFNNGFCSKKGINHVFCNIHFLLWHWTGSRAHKDCVGSHRVIFKHINILRAYHLSFSMPESWDQSKNSAESTGLFFYHHSSLQIPSSSSTLNKSFKFSRVKCFRVFYCPKMIHLSITSLSSVSALSLNHLICLFKGKFKWLESGWWISSSPKSGIIAKFNWWRGIRHIMNLAKKKSSILCDLAV